MKPGGLLEKAMKRHESRICENCRNLVQVSKTALGCAAHDKFILPDYPPYHGNAKCKDWERRRKTNDTVEEQKDD